MSDRSLPAGASVVVIGAGVTGLSAAWWLARDGVDVVVLDKGVVGWEASGRNGGGASHYQSPLFAEEQRLWPQLDALLGYPTEYRPERIIIQRDPDLLDHYRAVGRMCTAMGYPVDDLDSRQAQELVPLTDASCLGGIHLRFGGHANPQRTVQAYGWALQDLGGRVVQHCPAQAIELRGGRAAAVVTPLGTIACDALVVAAGPQSEALLAPIGIRFPLAAARAEMIVTEPAPLMAIGGVDGNGLYGRQTLRGNLAFGGGPHEWVATSPDGPGARPTSPLVRNLARRVAEMFPKAAGLNVIRSWAGIIENTPDGRPILDRPADPGNVTVATLSGVGFGLSPASGHAIRDLVTDGTCSFADIAKLGLARFANLEPDWRAVRGWAA
ncbi:MAG TPA: FAD-binding oxidoreductase [Sphingomonas sp.]|jgi:sarcosine oxidase subunit beta|uniref:NAD(P)/FAD-dependent oxidoreductase n=1 Tax=Sphingomonas sp. TaxID=28214 RepID=UPI002EDB3A17